MVVRVSLRLAIYGVVVDPIGAQGRKALVPRTVPSAIWRLVAGDFVTSKGAKTSPFA